MMFLICVSWPKFLPSPSLLGSMLGANFLILILSILIDIIMITISIYVGSQEMSQKTLTVPRSLKAMDLIFAGSFLAIYVLCALFMILSAPFLSGGD